MHNDHLGTSSFVTDGDGDPTQFYLNFPFGETLYEQQNTNAYENPYKFNAKELDDETGLYYYGARYYDPRIGMWLSVDPLTEKMPSWSPYAYAFDNPVRFVDLDGREPSSPLHDYILGRNGSIKLLRKTNDRFDRLFSSDMKNSITIEKQNSTSGSIISELANFRIKDDTRRYDNNKLAFPLGISRARTSNSSNVSNLFIFVSNNSDVEWGLAGYNVGNNMIYSLWTGHSEDITPSSILYQGISKLSFEIHSHPGNTTTPSPVNGFTEGDYGSAAWIDSKFTKDKNYPRHFIYSKKGKHLWEYNYYNETPLKFSPINSKLNAPMRINNNINLKKLEK
ncbi:RHS repeat-associated core domain-containing protein [Bergeyella zoohelcum]|uniref:Cell wall-associated polypeptide CWBP200 n=1 Tax=Bergeyella zoohelcum TaxID=1015 RepID=A0A380ZWR4_9FLAO|nr:RHS repeat-associated core domain-containing protein [Bergeyella zoohelcum]EKB58751.1 RHS repeat-associated core domain-containing protein [Bergeyella zoohelcum CCUG 30536]SUV53206.1 Cell wall-associated polypeptide CWBP200 [Bergeyella zoohelcum]